MGVLSWYEATLPNLTAWLRPSVGEDAEDLASEAILRTWLAERRGAAVHPGYAYRVARNLVIDLGRRRAVAYARLWAYIAEHPPSTPGPEDDLAPDALDDLTPLQRSVLLGYLRGDRQREIAADLGMSRSTVVRRQHRALVKLRRSAEGSKGDRRWSHRCGSRTSRHSERC
jgi:RNA polymerase sigma factor (sigma-70 family)